MRTLAFARHATIEGGRRVRAARFEDRSLLPVAAACVVASAIRETLGALAGANAELRLFEPSVPSPEAWVAILRDALIYGYRGPVAEAAIVLRPDDARSLARAAFGEPPAHGGSLSRIERGVLDRAVAAISPALVALCGGNAVERANPAAAFATYFELLVERPVEASIGIALAREPSIHMRASIALEDLGSVELPVCVELDAGTLNGADLAALSSGEVLPLQRSGGLRGRLRVGGRTLSNGRCGVLGGCYALELEGPMGERGATK